MPLHIVIKQVLATGIWSSTYVGTSGSAAQTAYTTAKRDALNSRAAYYRDPPWMARCNPARDATGAMLEAETPPPLAADEEDDEPTTPVGKSAPSSRKAGSSYHR